MEPTSVWVIILPTLAAVGLLVVMCRWRALVLRLFTGLFALALAMVTGMALVNDHYGYYQTWSALNEDLSGRTPDLGPVVLPGDHSHNPALVGRLEKLTISGAGISRSVLVYLPPGYRRDGPPLPVVELFHGSPGRPTDYLHLHLLQDMNEAISEHRIGPMVLVLPTINPGKSFEDCVNGPKGEDATYLTQVVPAFIRHHYRVSPEPGQWGLAGYSSGGYCAANLGLQQPGAVGAVAVMDGYFRPQDGEAGPALKYNPEAMARNDPLLAATRLRFGVRLPPIWVAAGTGDQADFTTARAFVRELSGVGHVTFEIDAGAHNFYAWDKQLPAALTWLWPQLATPALQQRYPTVGATVIRHPN